MENEPGITSASGVEDLRTLFDLVQTQYARQLDSRESLNTRAGIVFGLVPVLVGFVWTVKAEMPFFLWLLSEVWLVAALVCLLFVIWTRQYLVAPEPSEIINRYDRGDSMEEILRSSLASLLNAYEKNWEPLNKKIRWYRFGLVAVTLGLLFSAIGITV